MYAIKHATKGFVSNEERNEEGRLTGVTHSHTKKDIIVCITGYEAEVFLNEVKALGDTNYSIVEEK